jgi:hypothetical protein
MEPNAMCVAALLRNDGAIRNRVGIWDGHLHVAFVFYDAVFDVALDVVRIHRVGGEADGVCGDDASAAICLRHHVVGNHAPGLAHVELVSPVSIVGKFIRGQSPCRVRVADGKRDSGVILQRPDESTLPFLVLKCERVALCVSERRPVPAGAVIFPDEVGGNAAGVVRVGLAIGHRAELEKSRGLPGFDCAEEQLVVGFIVASGLGNHNAVCGDIREHHAETIRLQLCVAAAVGTACIRCDSGEKPAGCVARSDIRVDAVRQLVACRPCSLDAAEGFAVSRVCLATDGKAHASAGK